MAPSIGSRWFSDEGVGNPASNLKREGEYQEMLRERCANDNHGRAIVTIRFCPSCGMVVNKNILARDCADEKHAESRRNRNAFCVDCGEQLLQGGSGR